MIDNFEQEVQELYDKYAFLFHEYYEKLVCNNSKIKGINHDWWNFFQEYRIITDKYKMNYSTKIITTFLGDKVQYNKHTHFIEVNGLWNQNGNK